jgi:hypothetical protein
MVRALIFPSHIINLFQVLDLFVFDLFKHLTAMTDRDFEEQNVNDKIKKSFEPYEQTVTSFNIHGSFQRAGLHLDITSKPFKIIFVE